MLHTPELACRRQETRTMMQQLARMSCKTLLVAADKKVYLKADTTRAPAASISDHMRLREAPCMLPSAKMAWSPETPPQAPVTSVGSKPERPPKKCQPTLQNHPEMSATAPPLLVYLCLPTHLSALFALHASTNRPSPTHSLAPRCQNINALTAKDIKAGGHPASRLVQSQGQW